jgi:hypothetical protein
MEENRFPKKSIIYESGNKKVDQEIDGKMK